MSRLFARDGKVIYVDGNGKEWEAIDYRFPTMHERYIVLGGEVVQCLAVTLTSTRIIVRELPKPWQVPEIMRQLCPTGAVAIDSDGIPYFYTQSPDIVIDVWKPSDDCVMLSWRECLDIYGPSIGDPPTLDDAGGDWTKARWPCTVADA